MFHAEMLFGKQRMLREGRSTEVKVWPFTTLNCNAIWYSRSILDIELRRYHKQTSSFCREVDFLEVASRYLPHSWCSYYARFESATALCPPPLHHLIELNITIKRWSHRYIGIFLHSPGIHGSYQKNLPRQDALSSCVLMPEFIWM